jgi:hypothetical protein
VSDLSAYEAGEHIEVYDLVVQYLKEGCSWVNRWRTFQGGCDDRRPWADGDLPGVMLLPTVQDQGWQDPATFRGRLVVEVEIAIQTDSLTDLARAWRAVKRVFYPTSAIDREVIRTALQEAAGGIATGYVEFGGITYAVGSTSSPIPLARGRLSVGINELLTP